MADIHVVLLVNSPDQKTILAESGIIITYLRNRQTIRTKK